MEIKRLAVSEISIVQEIAAVAWPVTFKDILSSRQIDYMLDMMYSEASLIQQFNSDCIFFVLYEEKIPKGFASVQKINKRYTAVSRLYLLVIEICSVLCCHCVATVVLLVKEPNLHITINKLID